ncbi:hypothetical protein [Natronorubrum bangense]|uniref:Uncharacterized protein n=1 Tax=Natronorubrum bangense JCM 10635 TaxID=1227500 RepID=L9WK68_9EURY|nr:hypothetical protein [Natronorubrum bangense]ELY49880.1 hypothetical protein C494_07715 [Natronorubrum bangense JCM 10635]
MYPDPLLCSATVENVDRDAELTVAALPELIRAEAAPETVESTLEDASEIAPVCSGTAADSTIDPIANIWDSDEPHAAIGAATAPTVPLSVVV